MQAMSFTARCDVEIDDEVVIVLHGTNISTTIIDIRTVSYLKSGTVEFEFELECYRGKWLKRQDFTYTEKGGTPC